MIKLKGGSRLCILWSFYNALKKSINFWQNKEDEIEFDENVRKEWIILKSLILPSRFEAWIWSTTH